MHLSIEYSSAYLNIIFIDLLSEKRNEYVQSNVGDVHQVIKEGNELYKKG